MRILVAEEDAALASFAKKGLESLPLFGVAREGEQGLCCISPFQHMVASGPQNFTSYFTTEVFILHQWDGSVSHDLTPGQKQCKPTLLLPHVCTSLPQAPPPMPDGHCAFQLPFSIRHARGTNRLVGIELRPCNNRP